MPLGYAHGVAGIACALGRVARETGESTFAQSAGRAWSFIDRQFLPEACNWPVSANATPDACGTTRSMMAWCHGAPGIVLGRLDRLVGMPDTTPEIASALSAIARWPVGPVDSLCCGNLGRAEVLLEAGTQLGDAPLMGAARNLAMRVVTRAAARRHFGLSSSGFEYRIFTPGFFQGLSGIGYALLRLSSPSVLPSVLSFESVPPPARVAAHTGGGSWR
jgi:lantibiotic modifying enzyme